MLLSVSGLLIKITFSSTPCQITKFVIKNVFPVTFWSHFLRRCKENLSRCSRFFLVFPGVSSAIQTPGETSENPFDGYRSLNCCPARLWCGRPKCFLISVRAHATSRCVSPGHGYAVRLKALGATFWVTCNVLLRLVKELRERESRIFFSF